MELLLGKKSVTEQQKILQAQLLQVNKKLEQISNVGKIRFLHHLRFQSWSQKCKTTNKIDNKVRI